MRKIVSLILILALSLGLVCAHAEENNFLISDWMLLYTLGDNAIDEAPIFIHEDNTFELMAEDGSKKGTWTFDGQTLVLTGGDEEMTLLWNKEEHRFHGDFGGMKVTMYMSIEPEEENTATEKTAEAPETGMLAGGWSVAEDQTITDDINNLFWQAMDSYQTGTIPVAYTPVAVLGTQVVAGTNYAVLSKASEINKGTTWVIVYLYQDLEGNASVISVSDLALGV